MESCYMSLCKLVSAPNSCAKGTAAPKVSGSRRPSQDWRSLISAATTTDTDWWSLPVLPHMPTECAPCDAFRSTHLAVVPRPAHVAVAIGTLVARSSAADLTTVGACCTIAHLPVASGVAIGEAMA